jgi:hypothetical protein
MGITPDFKPRPAKPKTAAEATVRAREEAAAAKKAAAAAKRRRRWMIFGGAAAAVAAVLVLLNLGLFTPGGVEAQGNALRAIGMINTAQFIYSARHPDQGFATTLDQLQGDRLIDGRLAAGQVSGYTLRLTAGEPDKDGRVTSYTLTARSLAPGQSSFFADQTGVIRSTTEGRDATADDPPLGSGTPQPPPAE